MAGNGSPAGNFAAKHSGELNGRLVLSTGCGAPTSPTFVPAQAAKERPKIETTSVFVVFMMVQGREGVFRMPNVRAKRATTAGCQARDGDNVPRTAYRQTGPGGLPLALRLSEGLGSAPWW